MDLQEGSRSIRGSEHPEAMTAPLAPQGVHGGMEDEEPKFHSGMAVTTAMLVLRRVS